MKIICKNSCFFERICYNKVKSTSKEVTTMAFKITDDCIAASMRSTLMLVHPAALVPMFARSEHL